MLIDKTYLKNFKLLNIKTVTGGIFSVPVGEITEINCAAYDNPSRSDGSYRIYDGYLKISPAGGNILGEVFDEEEFEINLAYNDKSGDGLYLKNFFNRGCDVYGFSLVKENGEKKQFSVTYAPLKESIWENVIEYSNCPSAETDGDVSLTLFFGKSSKSPVRVDNNFNELICGWGSLFGEYSPDVLKVRIDNFKWLSEDGGSCAMAESEILNKRARIRCAVFTFKECENLNMDIGVYGHPCFELNIARLASGNIFVDFVGCGITFECKSINADEGYYCFDD